MERGESPLRSVGLQLRRIDQQLYEQKLEKIMAGEWKSHCGIPILGHNSMMTVPGRLPLNTVL
jgi:hypothetical protein